MNTHRSESAWYTPPPAASRARTLIFWSCLLLGVALSAGATLAAWMIQQNVLLRARTAEGVLGDVRVVGTALGDVQAGSSSDFDRLPALLTRIQRGLESLEKGGVSDYTPGKILDKVPSPGPWSPFKNKVVELEKALQYLRDSANIVREVAQAENTFQTTLAAMPSAIAAVQAQPMFNQPSWKNELDIHFRSFDTTNIDSVNTLFSPKPHLRSAQQKWSRGVLTTSAGFQQLVDLAKQDANVPNQAKEAISAFGANMRTLGESSGVLESRFEIRATLETTERVVRQEVLKALPILETGREQAWKGATWSAWAVWSAVTGLLLFLIGVIGIIRMAVVARRWQAMLTQESRMGHALQEQLGSTVGRMKTILDGNWLDRLPERPDEQIFTLNTMVNRILTAKDSAFRDVRTHLTQVLNSMNSLMNEATKLVDESGIQVTSLRDVVQRRSNMQEVWGTLLSRCHDLSRQIDKLIKDGKSVDNQGREVGWGSGKVHSTIQDIVIRLKKLGEVAQAMVSLVDEMRAMGRKVRVVSTNVAVQAVGSGESGRAFSVLARELHQLAQESTTSAKNLDIQMEELLSEAKGAGEQLEGLRHGLDKTVQGQDDLYRQIQEMLRGLDSVGTVTQDVKKGSLDFNKQFAEQLVSMQSVLDRAQSIDPVCRRVRGDIEKMGADVADAHMVCKKNSG